MNAKKFQTILDEQLARVTAVLGLKASEYARDSDRLQNFKTAGDLLHVSAPQALAGMMVKHTVSVYDMVGSGKTYPLALWDEKITDHINYLILLRAAIEENNTTENA